MGSVFRRGQKLWIKYKDTDGKWVNASTGLDAGQEKTARTLLVRVETQVAANEGYGPGPVTLRRYAKRWVEERRARGLNNVNDDETKLRLHILPSLGDLRFDEIRPRHVRDLVRRLRSDSRAPRTVRHIYATLRKMCNDAVVDEVVETSPCRLKRGDLPKNIDKDPAWRETAVFSRQEIETLISDVRIPGHRRVFYALQTLAGPRVSAGIARRWRDYDSSVEPLGKLALVTKYSSKRKREEAGTKTGIARYIPVHPTLARILAAWKLRGWAQHMGRHPGPDDLIVPDDNGNHWDGHRALKAFHADLATLGLRKRRLHDLRRSLVSLARRDGARKDIFEWITHGPRGDIVDMYTTLPWELLCEEMLKLKIELLEGKVIALPRAVASGQTNGPSDLVQSLVQTQSVTESDDHTGGRIVSHAAELPGGGGGIRTPGRFHVNGFQDRRLRPLGHSSDRWGISRRARDDDSVVRWVVPRRILLPTARRLEGHEVTAGVLED